MNPLLLLLALFSVDVRAEEDEEWLNASDLLQSVDNSNGWFGLTGDRTLQVEGAQQQPPLVNDLIKLMANPEQIGATMNLMSTLINSSNNKRPNRMGRLKASELTSAASVNTSSRTDKNKPLLIVQVLPPGRDSFTLTVNLDGSVVHT